MPIAPFITLLAISISPFCFFIIYTIYQEKKDITRFSFPKKSGSNIPRPPGWSLRNELNNIEFSFIFWLLILVTTPWAAGYFLYMLSGTMIAPLVIILVISIYVIRRLIKLTRQQRNYKLGLKGEEIVGQILSKLWGNNCSVFHDLTVENQTGRCWNIDHVVVAPTGVFVIETKCRRRDNSIKNKQSKHKVNSDGQYIHFPQGADAHGIQQTSRNAKWLSKKLTEITAENVECKGILTLPGWMVSETALSDVGVQNPLMIAHFIERHDGTLSKQQQQRISKWLDDHCKIDHL